MTFTERTATAERTHPELRSGNGEQPSDADLLNRFIHGRDETAFRQLLNRHAPMVLGVCRRILRNECDAEDAFQATFLVLVRKADSIRPRELIGNWLFGVAHNTALKARAMNAKRQIKERISAERPRGASIDELWSQVQPLLDREIAALPEKYRCIIVSCELEGQSLKEVAQRLRCPLGTIGTRLARARALLARRLTHRGVTVSVATIGLLLTQQSASAQVPPVLIDSTVQAASGVVGPATGATASVKVSGLVTAILQQLLFVRLKQFMVVAIVVLTLTTLAIASSMDSSRSSAAAQQASRRLRPDAERLQDTWVIVAMVKQGVTLSAPECDRYGAVTFTGEQFIGGEAMGCGKYKLEAWVGSGSIDFSLPRNPAAPLLAGPGIYKLDRQMLTICLNDSTSSPDIRPQDFFSRGGDQATTLIVLQRKNPKPCQCGPR